MAFALQLPRAAPMASIELLPDAPPTQLRAFGRAARVCRGLAAAYRPLVASVAAVACVGLHSRMGTSVARRDGRSSRYSPGYWNRVRHGRQLASCRKAGRRARNSRTLPGASARSGCMAMLHLSSGLVGYMRAVRSSSWPQPREFAGTKLKNFQRRIHMHRALRAARPRRKR